MGWFAKKPAERDPHLPVFTLDEAEAFRRDVRQVLGELGLTMRVSGATAEGDGQRFELETLARKVQTNDVAPQEVIRNHLSNMVAAFDGPSPSDQGPGAVILRLMPSDLVTSTPQIGGTRPWATGLVTALALDLPTAVATVTADDIERWGVAEDTLYETGSANLRRLLDADSPGVTSIDVGGQQIIFTESELLFHASRAFFLGEFAEKVARLDPTKAILFAVPSRHQLAFCQMSDDGSVVAQQAQSMIALAKTMYAEAPGPLSPLAYGWLNGNIGEIRLAN